MVVVSAAVEGSVDEVLVKRLISEAGGIPGEVYGKNGKLPLRTKINAYNSAARYRPWVVLVDLNHEADCAPDLCRAWLPTRSPKLCFRVAVREVEAWLLADREHISKFLSISKTRIPLNTELEENPKQVMVNLAALSRRRDIREDIFPVLRVAGKLAQRTHPDSLNSSVLHKGVGAPTLHPPPPEVSSVVLSA